MECPSCGNDLVVASTQIVEGTSISALCLSCNFKWDGVVPPQHINKK